ncbi:MAG: cobalt-precorrin-5B (C(1))-methyltransferase CbiD [Lachnospiraceae bacterium]|nr:cobalt-precorrin-5B (C(1))-methyltransferase CbiD [Lachnospiraceae bacterium]
MTGEPFLKIDALRAGYEKKPVLSGVSFSADRGEAVAVIGPNGAGKSTLLLTLAGLLKPMGGAAFLSGQDMADFSAGQRARNVAAMFTDRRQREPKTVRELVSEGRYPYTSRLGSLSEKDRAAVDEAMEMTDLASLAGRDIGELSDGQRQRAYIARALAQEPELLILDEPTGFLDVRYQIEIIGVLRKLCENNVKPVTILMTLHDLALLPKAADRVLMLKEGRQAGYGTASEMLTAEKISALFEISREEAAVYLPGGFYNSLNASNGNLQSSELTVRKGRKHLRYGFTTGTAAALAAKGAAGLLLGLSGSGMEALSLQTPKGIMVSVRPDRIEMTEEGTAFCAVRKDAGDDPDATDGLLISAEVQKVDSSAASDGDSAEMRVLIEGGSGIGRVTKQGLDQPVGNAAINSVPRRMITAACEEVMEKAGYEGGLSVTISAEGGEAVAEKTMNPVLGIEGGISIIGTSGIVEPMSEKALIDTIAVSLRQAAAEGNKKVILTPGNYGEEYIEKTGMASLGIPVVQVSNFIGDALDLCAEEGFTDVLLVGHAGKLVKLAGGLMNTHSMYGDCRMEILSVYAVLCGASAETVEKLMNCATTDAAADILISAGIYEETAKRVTEAVDARLQRKAAGDFRIGTIIFSKVHGLFGITDGAEIFLEECGFKGTLNFVPR